MIDKISDVRNALKNRTYLSALALALTFPDICCQVEHGLTDDQNSIRQYYIDWVNAHMETADFHFPVPGFEIQTFTGNMCYALRCKVLHNGNLNLKATAPNLNILIDEFRLTSPESSDYYCGYQYKTTPCDNGTTKNVTIIAVDYLCERLCDAAENFYNNWENKADFDQHSISLK
jgi:hypothetical protein